jgi:hypothetical protein
MWLRSARIARQALFGRGQRADNTGEARRACGSSGNTPSPAPHLLRKAPLAMTQLHAGNPPRRLRARLIALGFDGQNSIRPMITGEQCLVLGGSAETHDEMVETALRLDSELERLGRPLGELNPSQLAEIAWRIDSPELLDAALRIQSGLERAGRSFQESTPEQLTRFSLDLDL